MFVSRFSDYKYAYATDMRHNHNIGKIRKLMGLIKFISENYIAFPNKDIDETLNSAIQFSEIVGKSKIDCDGEYIYPWDLNMIRYVPQSRYQIASVTADYNWMLCHALKDKLHNIEKLPEGDFKKSLLITMESIKGLANRISKSLSSKGHSRSIQLANYMDRIWDYPCDSFDEAIQRILFYNALFWQNKHRQNGVGRLDYWLEPYYRKDLEKGLINRDDTKRMLREIVNILGKDQKAKSNSKFPGDTGQVIYLGGIDKDGNNVENDITHIIFELFEEHPVPDPKLILRVNSMTSDDIWKNATKSIIQGSGSPLIMNEEVIIPLMEKFGYEKEDLYNLGTSACWEPLIIGKSLDQNNCIPNIPIVKVVEDVLNKYNNHDYNEFLSNIESEIYSTISNWNLDINFDRSSLLSLFFDDCISSGRDFSQGGAKYNYHGILIVSLPNLINSILNIKKFVFDDQILDIGQCKECIESNYDNHEDLRELFSKQPLKFGSTNPEVVSLTQYIMDIIGNATSKREILGNKIKVGFSSPGYIGLAKATNASLDGRKRGEPFAVHISPTSSNIDVAEVLDFASKLDYSGCKLNGNVVDFIVPIAYANNIEKFASLLKSSFKKGVYETQLNVLDKATLLDAKSHPEKYPNLIVRVWGFSAYFKDLPEEYQDNLINRAESYHAN